MKAAKESQDKADVKIAQALKMVESARQQNEKYDALRKKLDRLERSVAAARGDEPHEENTRKSKLDAASTEAEQLQAAASEYLIGVAEDAGSDGEGVTALEELKRTEILVPLELKRKPEAAALIRLLKALAGHLNGDHIVLLVAVMFPVSFFSKAGHLLNREVVRLGPARAGTTWKERWANEVSGAWQLFSARLLATRGTTRDIAQPARENERHVRASVIYMIVAVTLNPSDTALLQGPLARMCSRGILSRLLGLLNTMGLTISCRKYQDDASLRIRESSAIEWGVLKAWLAPFLCPDGTMVYRGVRIHLDNWDNNFIHVHMAGMTLLNAPSKTVFPRNRLRELTTRQLITQTSEEAAAALQQLTRRAEDAMAGSTDERSEAAVKELVENDQAYDEFVSEEKKLRQSVKLGRKRGTQEENVDQQLVVASRDFDGGEPVEGHSGITFKAGEVIQLLYLMPPRELAAVEKDEGPHQQSGYVHYRHLAGYGGRESSSRHVHTPAKEVLARNARHRRSLEDVANGPSRNRLSFDDEGAAPKTPLLASSSAAVPAPDAWTGSESAIDEGLDAHVKQLLDAFFARNPDLPKPNSASTSLFRRIYSGLASNLDDARAVIEDTMKVINAAAGGRHVVIGVSVDGQEFLAEHTARDRARSFHRNKVVELERVLKLGGHSANERAALVARKEEAEAKLDAVSDMIPYELGALHTEFVLVRALWKKYCDAAYAGLLDRIGLGPLHDYLRECRAGSLHLSIEFFEVLVESYLTEIAVLQREEEAAMGSDHVDVLTFISWASEFSSVLKMYHLVFCTDPCVLLDMHTAATLRGSKAAKLLVSAQKRSTFIFATGGCSQYIKNILFHLAQLEDCPLEVRQTLETNMTTSVKGVRTVSGDLSSYHPDCYLEQFFIRLSKLVMGNVHESQVTEKSAELNATVGSTTGLEANVGKAAVDPVREHRARLKRPRAIVLMMRAAIRKFIIPAIRRQLEERRRQQQQEQAPEPMQEDNCSAEAMPRIPTRAEEQQVETRVCNPDFIKTQEIAIARVIEAAQWKLREEIGGLYNAQNVLKNFIVISFFRKIVGQALAAVKKQSDRALAVVSYLSGNPAAAAAINSLACLAKFIGNEPVLNGGPKHQIRNALRVVFGGSAAHWVKGDGAHLIPLGAVCVDASVPIHHVILDAAMFMRQLPPVRKQDKTFGEVVIAAMRAVIAPRCAVYKKTWWVEDVGDCLSKRMQERKRDLEKLGKETAGASVPSESFEGIKCKCDTDVSGRPKGFLSKLYGDRTCGRRIWQKVLRELVDNGDVRKALGVGGNEVSFSGVGSSEDERKRTITLGAGSVISQLSTPSNQREDTEAIHQAVQTINEAENAIIEAQDTDIFCIGTLAADKQQQLLELSREERTLGKLFVRMTSQDVPLSVGSNSGSFSEEYWCCNDLATQIKAYPGFSKLRAGTTEEVVAFEYRVPSVIALFILLGGDTTSYLYLPYAKSLEWYLSHAEFVGALVRILTEEELREGWPLVSDEEAVKRLFKMLYACRNPDAIDRWTSLPLPERYAALRDTSYEDLESKVARCVFPLTMRFMPKWALMVQHLLRAQHRLRTWYNADLSAPPDVPLVGHVVLMAPPSGTMDEDGIQRLEAPTEAAVAVRSEEGWSVMRVAKRSASEYHLSGILWAGTST